MSAIAAAPLTKPGIGEARAAAARTRRCIVTNEVLPEGRLLRFAADPAARIVPDVAAKLPGRGLWVRAERAAITQAVAKNLFARAAKAPLAADADLPERAEARIVAHMLETLGLARRAGQLILGCEKIAAALRGPNPPAVIIEAAEAAADGRRKLQAAAVANSLVPYVIGCFTGAELSLAVGSQNVVHAALNSGRIAERLVFDAGRLAGFRPLKSWAWKGFAGNPETARGQTASTDERRE